MNRVTQSLYGFMFAATCIAMQSAHANGIAKSIQDMDDESRAVVVRELVKSKSYTYGVTPKNRNPKSAVETDEDNVQSGSVKQGCNMEVANTKSEPGRPTARRITVVVTGPIVQVCDK